MVTFHPKAQISTVCRSKKRPVPRGVLRSTGRCQFSVVREKAGSVNHVDGFLRNGIECGHGLGVSFECALRNDQVGEFSGDIHV
jgi:hypothetical protein